MDRHYFNPTPDMIYTNKGGGSYICLEAEGHFRAKFQRVSKYKWTVEPPDPICSTFSVHNSSHLNRKFCGYSNLPVAHGCQMYEDGTMEWDSPQADTSRNNTVQMGLQVPHFK